MVQYSPTRLDRSFSALSDPTRRGMLEQLGHGEASITNLAKQFRMTLTGMKKHVAVLERAGLITTSKVGRVRTCKLGELGLDVEAEWIEGQRRLFEARFDALGQLIGEIKREEDNGSG